MLNKEDLLSKNENLLDKYLKKFNYLLKKYCKKKNLDSNDQIISACLNQINSVGK